MGKTLHFISKPSTYFECEGHGTKTIDNVPLWISQRNCRNVSTLVEIFMHFTSTHKNTHSSDSIQWAWGSFGSLLGCFFFFGCVDKSSSYVCPTGKQNSSRIRFFPPNFASQMCTVQYAKVFTKLPRINEFCNAFHVISCRLYQNNALMEFTFVSNSYIILQLCWITHHCSLVKKHLARGNVLSLIHINHVLSTHTHFTHTHSILTKWNCSFVQRGPDECLCVNESVEWIGWNHEKWL